MNLKIIFISKVNLTEVPLDDLNKSKEHCD